MLAFGVIGFYDDYRKLVFKDSRGLPARWKYFWQSVCGLAAASALYHVLGQDSPAAIALYVPLFKQVAIPLGIVFVVIGYFMIVGFSNAVNLTDGLDGLAIMPTVLVASALGVFAYAAGQQCVFRRICKFRRYPVRESCAFSAVRWPVQGLGFCGSTLIPRRCSWAMSARLRSALRSAPWP